MNIILFSDTYPPQINGVATACYTLEEALKKKGQKVTVVCPAEEGQSKLTYIDNVIRLPGITIKKFYHYKFTGIYDKEAFALIKKLQPDVIHVQTEAGVGIFGRIAASRLKVPLIYTYHTMYRDYTYYVTKNLEPFDEMAKKIVEDGSVLLGDNTSEFITTSIKTKLALEKYGVTKYINVIPNGIDFSSFDKENIDFSKVKEIREKYGLEGKFSILVLGRLAEEKGIDALLSFFKALKKDCPSLNFKVLIVGDGPEKTKLMKETEESGLSSFICFAGAVKHSLTPYFYRAADLFVSNSLSETQGLTYIEAMASSELVLAHKDLNLKDVIIEKKTGFYFADYPSFKEGLLTIMNLSEEEKDKVRKEAATMVKKLYSTDLYAERVLNVYEKALRKNW